MDEQMVGQALEELARERPIFHSEADFQHALAWKFKEHAPHFRVRLEVRAEPGGREALDLLVRDGARRIGVELKYLVRQINTVIDDEPFELRDQSAHDVCRYDVVNDLVRRERFIDADVLDQGFFVAMSNDPAFWTPWEGASADADFRVHEGRRLSGSLQWGAGAGEGTRRSRSGPLKLSDTYVMRWSPYSDLGQPNGTFRHLSVMVPG